MATFFRDLQDIAGLFYLIKYIIYKIKILNIGVFRQCGCNKKIVTTTAFCYVFVTPNKVNIN